MQANIKTKNRKKLEVKTLVDSGCTHTGIDEQLVKDKKIPTKPINFSFKVFNADSTKNREVTKVTPLKIKIDGHTEQFEAAVTDLDTTDMFLGHDWLVKHNPEVNWKNSTIQFTRCPEHCIIKHKDIQFNTSVVATTFQNSTCSMLTSAKLSISYLVVEITRELDKEPLLHCSSIYINTSWSVLQQ